MKTDKYFKRGVIIGIILGSILLSCRTPQQLIDKAIEKDPTIVNGFSDTLTIIKTRVDSVAVEVDGKIVYKDTLITEYKDTVINCDQINIERKKTRQQIRLNYKLEKKALKLQAKLDKLEKKNEKLQSKLDAKTEQKQIKEDGKTERTTVRKENSRGNWFWFGFLVGVVSFGFLIFVLWRAKLITLGTTRKSNN